MPLPGASQLAALVVLVGLQGDASAALCGCEQFGPEGGAALPDPAVLSDDARRLRDFILFSHRRIGADLIRQEGAYLETLLAFFPHCADRQVRLAWLRAVLAGTSDTREFAERLARQHDAIRPCSVIAR